MMLKMVESTESREEKGEKKNDEKGETIRSGGDDVFV